MDNTHRCRSVVLGELRAMSQVLGGGVCYPSNDIRYSNNRTPCPECKARAWAGYISFNGQQTDPTKYGYCHACRVCKQPLTTGGTRYAPPQSKPATRLVSPETRSDTASTTSPLHTFLAQLAGRDMTSHLRQWCVGTDGESRTVWHYVNYYGDHVTSKGMLYGTDGKRDKRTPPRYAVRRSDGRIERLTKEDGYSTCLYGECFLRDGMSLIDYRTGAVHTYSRSTTIFLVESEKSAVLGSFMLPQFVWVATGGVSGLGNKNTSLWKGRTVVVLFDADNAGKDGAVQAMDTLTQAGASVKKADPNNVFGSDVPNGFDIADYFVQHYSEYNEDTERLAIVEADLQRLGGAV